MNNVSLIGRLTRDPDVRYSQAGNNSTCVSRYTLAVNRPFKSNDEQNADFISCVAFGKAGEFAEKYMKRGMLFAVTGRIQTGSYTNRDGKKVYTTDIVVSTQEFCEKRSEESSNGSEYAKPSSNDLENKDGFMHIPDGVEDEGLPFN